MCAGGGALIRCVQVQTEAQIAKSFVTLRKNVRLVEYVPEGGGMFAHLLSGAVSYITFQRRGLAQGDAPDAVMSRAEYYLDQGDLEQVLNKNEPRVHFSNLRSELRAIYENVFMV